MSKSMTNLSIHLVYHSSRDDLVLWDRSMFCWVLPKFIILSRDARGSISLLRGVALQSKRKYFRGGAGQGAISSGQGRETVNGNYMDNTCATFMITWTILGSIDNAGAPIGTNMDHLEQRWGNLETTSDNAATILTPYRIKSLYLRKNNMKNFHFLEPFPDQHYIWSIFQKTEFDCW